MITKKTNKSRSFDAYFQDKLKDPAYARDYIKSTLDSLNAATGDTTPEEFLATLIGCLRDIVEAHGGVNQFAKKIPELHRSTLYGIFSDNDKRKRGPEFMTVLRIMRVCGVSLTAA